MAEIEKEVKEMDEEFTQLTLAFSTEVAKFGKWASVQKTKIQADNDKLQAELTEISEVISKIKTALIAVGGVAAGMLFFGAILAMASGPFALVIIVSPISCFWNACSSQTIRQPVR